MKTLFLSHSIRDKASVEQLAVELKKRNISVWFDEWEINVGDSIPAKVQEGLMNARFVAVWLTAHSINDGWVTKEWHATIYQETSAKNITVLPLLAEDCEVPIFLSDKKYADFRVSFHEGVASLMRTLSRQNLHDSQAPANSRFFSVGDHTRGFLKDLEEVQIPFPTVGNLKIIKSLKSLPRSGKLLRLEGMLPRLPIRSVYDHILSIAHSADCLLPLLDPQIYENNRVDLARIIAYHDICEVILGDIPQYTKLNRTKRSRARVTSEIRLSQMKEGDPERITNKFIGMFLQDSERYSLQRTVELMSGDLPVKKVFYALDKIDPIVAVWRYIHNFRADPTFKIDEFMIRMRHFFENPRVRIAVKIMGSDPRMFQLADHLQNPSKARQYYEDDSLLQDQLFIFSEEVVRKLVEGRKLEFAPMRSYRRRRFKSTESDE